MTVKTRPHYTLPATELAQWLDIQGDEYWWNVDGDPLLTGVLSFPCPSSELARELRRIGGNLWLQDKEDKPQAEGQSITAAQLGSLAYQDDDENRSFMLTWPSAPEGFSWLLTEDRESSTLFSAHA